MRFILSVIFLVLVTGYCNAQSLNLSGSWQLDWGRTYDSMSQDEKDRFNAMPEETRTRISSGFGSRNFNFNSSGAVSIEWAGRNGSASESGTWSLSGTTLTITVGSVSRSYTLSGDSSGLTLQMNASSNAVFSSLVLVKQP